MPNCVVVNKYFNILFVLVFALALASCAKEELEGPAESAIPQAIMKLDSEAEGEIVTPEFEDTTPTPVYINDDGDEEDEGLTPNLPSSTKGNK